MLPIFLRPAVLHASESSSEDSSAPSILDALKTLNIQCQVFKRNAEDLGEHIKIFCNVVMHFFSANESRLNYLPS